MSESGNAQDNTEPTRGESSGPAADSPMVEPQHSLYGDDLFCPDCGYSLRGLTSERCPECGLKLDFIESDRPVIPWERRREIGRIRAYWQTVFQVVFRTKLFCRAVFRPVSYGDAQWFRGVTIAHAALPIMLGPPLCHVLGADFPADVVGDYGLWFAVVVYICALLGLIVFTGLPSHFFHPRLLSIEQQNRAVALSYYGCAPLAFAWLGVSMIVSGVALDDLQRIIDSLLVFLGQVFLVVLATVCWAALLEIATKTLRRPSAVAWMAVALPPLWIITVGMIAVGLPLILLYCLVIFHSLR